MSNSFRLPRPGGPALLAVLAMLAGCSQPAAVPAVVAGKVTLGGVPLTAGGVLFMNDAGDAASAELAADGTYTLQCKPARYKVAVTPPAPIDPLGTPAGAPPRPASPAPAVPKRYHELATSGLTCEVKEGNNTFDIPLTR